MAASDTVIANLALRFLGDDTRLTDVSTEILKGARAARDFLEIAKRETLVAYNWRFARRHVDLTPIATLDETEHEPWRYVYRLPTNCAQPRRIVRRWRHNPAEYEVPWETRPYDGDTAWDVATAYTAGQYASVTVGSVTTWYIAIASTTGEAPASTPASWTALTGVPPDALYTILEEIRLEYTEDVTDVRRYPPDVDNAVAARLAYYMAPTVGTGSLELGNAAARTWDFLIRQAAAMDAQRAFRDPDPPSSFELAMRE